MIRPATLNDVNALEVLINSAYRGESSKKGWTTEADLLGGIRTDKESLKELLLKSNATLLVLESEIGLAGCVYLEIQGNALYLGMLTVSPELQNAGIGKKLMLAAEGFARQHSLPKITMTVISVRHELIAWYERHGYQKTGERKPFPMNDPKFGLPKQFLEFVVMEKNVF